MDRQGDIAGEEQAPGGALIQPGAMGGEQKVKFPGRKSEAIAGKMCPAFRRGLHQPVVLLPQGAAASFFPGS